MARHRRKIPTLPRETLRRRNRHHSQRYPPTIRHRRTAEKWGGVQCGYILTHPKRKTHSEEILSGLLVEIVGVEPTTPCLQSRCSSQLSYTPECGCKDATLFRILQIFLHLLHLFSVCIFTMSEGRILLGLSVLPQSSGACCI